MIGSLLDALPRAIPRSGMARLDRGTTTNTELAALRELAAASGSSVNSARFGDPREIGPRAE
jgi:hypothetical protein